MKKNTDAHFSFSLGEKKRASIAIASGKGGTGKTTVSINLQKYISEKIGESVTLVDCDVEEPNDMIFFSNAKELSVEKVFQSIPIINKDKCTYCGRCAEYCEFNAISIISSHQYAKVDGGLCHSCGACLEACKFDAIDEKPEEIGQISFYQQDDCKVAEGRLKVGSPMQTMVIKTLKKRVGKDAGVALFDAPPGTSCSVVETISDMDYVVLVVEPTLFGVHDMKLMVELVRNLNLPFGLVINKAGLGDEEIYSYVKEQQIDILGEIPFSKAYAGRYAKGEILNKIPKEIEESYKKIIKSLPQPLQRRGV